MWPEVCRSCPKPLLVQMHRIYQPNCVSTSFGWSDHLLIILSAYCFDVLHHAINTFLQEGMPSCGYQRSLIEDHFLTRWALRLIVVEPTNICGHSTTKGIAVVAAAVGQTKYSRLSSFIISKTALFAEVCAVKLNKWFSMTPGRLLKKATFTFAWCGDKWQGAFKFVGDHSLTKESNGKYGRNLGER